MSVQYTLTWCHAFLKHFVLFGLISCRVTCVLFFSYSREIVKSWNQQYHVCRNRKQTVRCTSGGNGSNVSGTSTVLNSFLRWNAEVRRRRRICWARFTLWTSRWVSSLTIWLLDTLTQITLFTLSRKSGGFLYPCGYGKAEKSFLLWNQVFNYFCKQFSNFWKEIHASFISIKQLVLISDILIL